MKVFGEASGYRKETTMKLVTDSTEFCAILMALPKAIKSGVISFTPEGICITGIDPSLVSIVRILVNKIFFQDYDFGSGATASVELEEKRERKTNATVDFEALLNIAKVGSKYKSKVGANANASFSSTSGDQPDSDDEEVLEKKGAKETKESKKRKSSKTPKSTPTTKNTELIVKTDCEEIIHFDFKKNGGNRNKEIPLKLREPEDPFPLMDDNEHLYKVKMDAKEFEKLCKDASGSTLKFTLRPGFMSVETEDEYGSPCKDNYKDCDDIIVTAATSDQKEMTVSFAKKIIVDLTSPQNIAKYVYLQFHPVSPLRIRYHINDNKRNGFIEYYLAPTLSVDPS